MRAIVEFCLRFRLLVLFTALALVLVGTVGVIGARYDVFPEFGQPTVTIVTNATRDFSNAQLSITVSYHENVDRVCAVLTGIGHEMRAEPAWGAMMRDDLQIFGLDSFGDLGLVISAQIRTGPGQHYAVRREFYRRVQQRFAEQGIVIPLGQQRVFKLEMPPAAPEPPAKAL